QPHSPSCTRSCRVLDHVSTPDPGNAPSACRPSSCGAKGSQALATCQTASGPPQAARSGEREAAPSTIYPSAPLTSSVALAQVAHELGQGGFHLVLHL